MPDDVSELGKAEALQARTKQSALRVLHLFQSLPPREDARIIGRQLLRSATSVGADYRAACRARSRKEFASKIGLVVEEADETVFWLQILVDGPIIPAAQLKPLQAEANQPLAIFAASHRTARKKKPTQDAETNHSMTR